MGRLLAYVWPAVALDRYKGLLVTLVADLKRSVPLSAAFKVRLAPPERGDKTAAGNSSPTIEAPGVSHGPRFLEATLATGATTILYAAVAALLTLFAFAVWAELKAAIRSRSATDRWHQGL
ncbi:MAG: hypothetical protein ACTHKT_10550 [Solirubrobacterales bacterium]